MTPLPLLLRPIFGLLLALLPVAVLADEATEVAALTQALTAAKAEDWGQAQAQAMAAGPAGAAVIEWLRLRASQGLLGDYEVFLARHPDWPGLPLLREKGEVAVARSTDAARVIAYFGPDAPATAGGALALIRALDAVGRKADAETVAITAWSTLKFTADEQTALIDLHGPALRVADEVRLDRILWDGDRAGEAARMLPRVSPAWAALAHARIALRSDADGVTALVNAVPQGLASDAGLAYERFLYRMRHDNYADAAALIIERSATATGLGDPDAWAAKRADLARALIRADEPRTAYRVAANHHLTTGAGFADLEFLAGFIALRKLHDPDTALTHFRRLTTASKTAITVARGYYWVARSYDAAGNAARAKANYTEAAKFQTAYYGLLAAEHLGLSLDPALIANPRPADWRQAGFATSSVLAAAVRLAKAGDAQLSGRFFLHLAEGLTETELDQLADLALQLHQYRSAVLIAKAAAERGVILIRPYYPIPDVVPDDLAVSRALALAISRRESEFDPAARSSAGALGLMQLLPETAAHMAAKLGLDYATSRLTSDPGFNVTLGSEYLRSMADEFGPAVPLIASGYNAGPRRPRDWIAKFGDPRRSVEAAVDWVETIPFTETRTYVMRVTESVVIYRARLRGTTGPVRIGTELTGR